MFYKSNEGRPTTFLFYNKIKLVIPTSICNFNLEPLSLGIVLFKISYTFSFVKTFEAYKLHGQINV